MDSWLEEYRSAADADVGVGFWPIIVASITDSGVFEWDQWDGATADIQRAGTWLKTSVTAAGKRKGGFTGFSAMGKMKLWQWAQCMTTEDSVQEELMRQAGFDIGPGSQKMIWKIFLEPLNGVQKMPKCSKSDEENQAQCMAMALAALPKVLLHQVHHGANIHGFHKALEAHHDCMKTMACKGCISLLSRIAVECALCDLSVHRKGGLHFSNGFPAGNF
jgi:hypothetical protein